MKLLREPLLHFLVLGAVLFLLYGLVGDSDEAPADEIVVTKGQIAQLIEGWSRTWQRPPTQIELDGLVEDFIREEVYYREALAMGLDRDDTIVRRRMRQKLEFLAGDLVSALDPTEEQLRRYLEENGARFRKESSLSFQHVFFNFELRGDAAQSDAEALLARLATAGAQADLTALGDPLLLPNEYQQASLSEIAGRFGDPFAARLDELPVGRWVGPIESGYGLHLVRIGERTAGQAPAFEEVRQAVEREWRSENQQKTSEAFYQGLRARYSIVVEDLP